jgi:hypothetical protein
MDQHYTIKHDSVKSIVTTYNIFNLLSEVFWYK